MAAITRVALIGFGEVGRTLAPNLKAAGAEISAYDILFDDAGSKPSLAIEKMFVREATSAADSVAGAELIISAVTAASDIDAAGSVAPAIPRGAFYLDVNSVSPKMKRACAAIIDGAGGCYVEAAVMTPISPKGIGSPMLFGGPHAARFLELAAPLGFSARVFSGMIGQASAVKMCRSVIIKGTEALLIESMLAARLYGVEKPVLDSLSDLLPVGDWEKLARYFISRSLEHGVRRAEEMREAAKTVSEADVEPLMALATAEREDWAAAYRDALSEKDLGALLDAIRAAMNVTAKAAE